MEKYEAMNYTEKKEFTEMLWTWLKDYTDEVINYVLTEKIDEIMNSDTAIHLLKELHEREQKEAEDNISSLGLHLEHGGKFARLNVLTHANSYRDILHDLYLKDWRSKEVTVD